MKHKQYIPYATILAAKEGDAEAIAEILRHFDRYIEVNSCHPKIPGFNNSGGGLSVDIKERIQEKLIDRILYYYDAMRLPEGEILEL